MDAFILLASFFYLIIAILIFFQFKRRSKFYVFFLASEYFYILGLGLYPVFLSIGLLEVNGDYKAYSDVSDISILTPIHIVFYALGGFFGCFSGSLSEYFSGKVVNVSKNSYLNPDFILYYLCFLVFLPFLVLVSSFGFMEVITSAALRRGGDFDFSEGLGRQAFLIKIMTLGLFMIVVYPYYVIKGVSVFKVSFFVALSGLVIYSVTVSRYALFQSFILLFAVYWSFNNRRLSVNFLALIFVFCAPIILLYGKSFVPALGAYLSGSGDLKISTSLSFSSVMMNFGHLFYSIDAGIRSFLESGPLISKDIFLSPLGIIPSRFFEALGLSEFSYQFIDDLNRSACVNTKLLGVEGECYVPPYYTGVSAYVMPIIGGFLFGYIRFLLFSSISKAWQKLEKESGSVKYIPIVLIFYFFIEQLMLFIPNVISLMVFFLLNILFFRVLVLNSKSY